MKFSERLGQEIAPATPSQQEKIAAAVGFWLAVHNPRGAGVTTALLEVTRRLVKHRSTLRAMIQAGTLRSFYRDQMRERLAFKAPRTWHRVGENIDRATGRR